MRGNYKFDTINNGTVTTAYELGKRGWKVDRIDYDESLSVVTVGQETYVLKTEDEYNGAEFDIYVDRDGDGLWSKIAEGETTDAYLNDDGSVDLVGIITDGILAPATVVTI